METEENEYLPEAIIRDLFYMQNFLPRFFYLNEDYKELVEILLQRDLYGKGTPFPSLNEIQEELGINYQDLKEILIHLWDDILYHDSVGINFSINKVEYKFILEYSNKVEYLIINDLPIIPRVGEKVRFPFLRATFGTESFYVSKIEHHFGDTEQSIDITLAAVK